MRRALAIQLAFVGAASAEPATVHPYVPPSTRGFVADLRFDYTRFASIELSSYAVALRGQYTWASGFGVWFDPPLLTWREYLDERDFESGSRQFERAHSGAGVSYIHRDRIDLGVRAGIVTPIGASKNTNNGEPATVVSRPADFGGHVPDAFWLHVQSWGTYREGALRLDFTLGIDLPFTDSRIEDDGDVPVATAVTATAAAGFESDALGVSAGVSVHRPLYESSTDPYVAFNAIADVDAGEGLRPFLALGVSPNADRSQAALSAGVGLRWTPP